MTARDSAAFRFGNFLLLPAARELHCGGERVPLAPKVLDAMLWLFEHRERAVGRDELSAAVWSKANVTDTQLDQLVRNLRRAVGDNGSSQDVIRTVPRFGYRWVAEVELLPAMPEPTAANLSASTGPDAISPADAPPAVPPPRQALTATSASSSTTRKPGRPTMATCIC